MRCLVWHKVSIVWQGVEPEAHHCRVLGTQVAQGVRSCSRLCIRVSTMQELYELDHIVLVFTGSEGVGEDTGHQDEFGWIEYNRSESGIFIAELLYINKLIYYTELMFLMN